MKMANEDTCYNLIYIRHKGIFNMQTKLTLRIDNELIEKVKVLSEKLNVSLSKMVSDYFYSLLQVDNLPEPSSPLLDEIMGVLKQKEPDYKVEYHEYLESKYL